MRKRNNEIKIRLTDAELAHLDGMVSRTNYSREGFIRSMLDGYQITEAPNVEMRSLINHLTRIGTNLNILTSRAFVNHFVDEPTLRKETAELWELRDDIRRMFIPYIRPRAKEENHDE